MSLNSPKNLTAIEETEMSLVTFEHELKELPQSIIGYEELRVYCEISHIFISAYHNALLQHDPESLIHLRRALNRALSTELILCCESIFFICSEDLGQTVVNRKARDDFSSAIAAGRFLPAQVDTNPNDLRDVKKWLKGFKDDIKPQFSDYLEGFLATKKIANDEKSRIRHIFIGLTTIRNKSSHMDTSLNESEIEKIKYLENLGLQVRLAKDGFWHFEVTILFFIEIFRFVKSLFGNPSDDHVSSS